MNNLRTYVIAGVNLNVSEGCVSDEIYRMSLARYVPGHYRAVRTNEGILVGDIIFSFPGIVNLDAKFVSSKGGGEAIKRLEGVKQVLNGAELYVGIGDKSWALNC